MKIPSYALHNHHKRNSSVTSISATAAKNPEKIEKIQEFEKWRHEMTALCFDLVISSVNVHASHRNHGNFILECTAPSGHWMLEKSFEEFVSFQKKLFAAFPVEAGQTGKPRILPKVPLKKCPKWILLNKEIHAWHLVRIERFMRVLLTCTPLVAKSMLMNDFMKTGILNGQEEQKEAWNGKSLSISTPMTSATAFRCVLMEFDRRSLCTEDDETKLLLSSIIINEKDA